MHNATLTALRLAAALAALKSASAPAQTIIYVDDDAPPGGNGLTWNAAFRDLQDALDAARKNAGRLTEIDVAQGVYSPDRGTGDPGPSFDISVTSGAILRLFGGFAGVTAPDPNARNPRQYQTILNGDLAGDDAGGFDHREDNSASILRGEGGGRRWIDGFTITGGGNESSSGGGIRVLWGALDLSRCRFALNQGLSNHGGAVFAETDAVNAWSCEFVRNRARRGGAIMMDRGVLRTVNCRFVDNHAIHLGGAVWASGPAFEAANCEFVGNVCDHHGGAIVSMNSLTVASSTFVGNRSGNWDSVIRSWGDDAVLLDSIVWANAEVDGHVMWGMTRVEWSCIQGGWPGDGNIQTDPLFLDPIGPDGLPATGDEDFRLAPGSPCIDAGANPDLPPDWPDLDADGDTAEPIPLDLDGRPRATDDPGTDDTGIGPPPVVDMGAHEFETCPADCNGDGATDLFDYTCFVNAFGGQDVAADCTGDGNLDLFDFLCFVNVFITGC